KGPLYQLLCEKNESVFVLSRYGRLDPLYYIRLWRFLKKYHIRLMILSNRIPGLLGRLLRIRSVQRCNQPVQRLAKFGRLPGVNSFLYGGIDHLICVSQSILDDIALLEKISPEKMSVIYNGIELEDLPQGDISAFRKQYDLNDSGKIVGLLGRLHPQKGIEYFLDAIPLILQEFPDCWFLLCGSGELESSLKQQSQSLGIASRVRFLGFQREALKILSCFDISVMSSRWEGFPFVALETFSLQKPLVATRVGGIPELVDETNGILVEPENATHLALGILKLLKDPKLTQQLAQAGYEKVKIHYSGQTMAQQTEALYLRLLAKN
ncbi:MAG: glycosyltransferase, partial [Planctomycetota bacterium]